MSTSSRDTQYDLEITREYTAPRSLVFQAWTDAAKLAQWWGPRGFTTPVCRAEAHPGGELYLEMCGPKGSSFERPYPMWGQFVEVIAPETLVFLVTLKNADGSTFLENLNTVNLTEHAGTTTLHLQVHVLVAADGAEEPLSGMPEGWKQSLDKLGEYLTSL